MFLVQSPVLFRKSWGARAGLSGAGSGRRSGRFPMKYLLRASGRDANVEAAQHALLQQASYNRAARRGEYSAAMEGT